MKERPARAEARGCFLFDQQLFQLPAWETRRADDRGRRRAVAVLHRRRGRRGRSSPIRRRTGGGSRWCGSSRRSPSRACGTAASTSMPQPSTGAVGVVVIAGPKHSGKTTLALHLLAGGGRWVGNDRVLLDGIGGVPRARRPERGEDPTRHRRRFPELGGIDGIRRGPTVPPVGGRTRYRRALRMHRGRRRPRVRPPRSSQPASEPTACAEAPLGAYAFPQVSAAVTSAGRCSPFPSTRSSPHCRLPLRGRTAAGHGDAVRIRRRWRAHTPTAEQTRGRGAAAVARLPDPARARRLRRW